MSTQAPPDACPACHPGIPDAALPTSADPVPGGIVAAYDCGSCGARWRTWHSCDGWPAARVLEPVTDEQAEINKGVLLEALAEQERERKHAA
jgi:hypothetical protein